MGLFKRRGNWYIDYRYPAGRDGQRIREKIGPVKDEAQIVLSTRLQDIRMGRDPALRIIKPRPFEDVLNEFSTIAMTQRYAHLSADHLQDGARFFGASVTAAVGGHSVDTTGDPVASF